ncbi:S1C family serine protease [Rhodobaculum claviforme]|uniref:Trypsin-like peptidase domain-containing protein n=1 Tax=Rhodobaculum claviforme TaxID=1549854 RepID=A0A934WHP9_9RHOB|nr:S1C family serine protease [Rhodobaculum claviforme]MBK5925952.1 hypothetical protein [Rhodobaculum claviforme]
MRQAIGAIILAAAGPWAGAAAACPDWRLAEDAVTHSSDALWTPQTYALTAGGDHNLRDCDQPGAGYVVAAPDLRLRFTDNAAQRDLFIRVEGDCDTVLLVNDPATQWHFNDDFDGLDPAIALPRAAEGSYDIWVGTFGRDLCAARLVLETFGPGQAPGPGGGFGDPGGGVAGSGTGFVVNREGWALTNAHVVAGCTTLEVAGTTVTRVIEDDGADLAAILLDPAPGAAPLPLRSTLARLAEPVHAIGYPLADILTPSVRATSGSVNALSGFDGGESLIQISAPVQPGNSGGPVIDAGGAVIGVLSATLSEDVFRGAQNVNFAVPTAEAIRFLSANAISHTLVPTKGTTAPAAPLAAWEVVEAAAAATILIRCLD